MGGLQFLNKDAIDASQNGGGTFPSLSDLVGSEERGRQRTNGKPKHSISASHMQETIELLKKRLKARIALYEMVSSLGNDDDN